MKTFKISYSLDAIIITVLTVILYICFVGYRCYTLLEDGTILSTNKWELILIIVLTTILIIVYAYSPKYLRIDSDQLVLKQRFGNIIIPLDKISRLENFRGVNNIRIFASGGIFGYFGKYRNNYYIQYYAFAGDFDKAFTLRLTDGKVYVLSCDDPILFSKELNKAIACK
jgi:hypothetical protein